MTDAEIKKSLPPHLQELVEKMEASQKEKEIKFGFTVKDVTPKGYGPDER